MSGDKTKKGTTKQRVDITTPKNIATKARKLQGRNSALTSKKKKECHVHAKAAGRLAGDCGGAQYFPGGGMVLLKLGAAVQLALWIPMEARRIHTSEGSDRDRSRSTHSEHRSEYVRGVLSPVHI